MPSFSGNGMYIDLFQSLGYSQVSHIFSHRIVTIFVPSFPVTFVSSYCIYDRNLALHCSEILESICVVRTDIRPVMMIRVNSKSELVEDREGKSALYHCNLLLCRQVILESCNMWLYGLDPRNIRLTVVSGCK